MNLDWVWTQAVQRCSRLGRFSDDSLWTNWEMVGDGNECVSHGESICRCFQWRLLPDGSTGVRPTSLVEQPNWMEKSAQQSALDHSTVDLFYSNFQINKPQWANQPSALSAQMWWLIISVNASSSASRVRALAERKNCLSEDQHNSIGERSGE